MDMHRFMELAPYTTNQQAKEKWYAGLLTDRIEEQRTNCVAYDQMLRVIGCPPGSQFSTMEEIPFLPVSIFKEMDLKSVPEDQVYKTMTSSGTTGQKVSRIHLDSRTSRLQQEALYRIVADFVGEERLPYLILDSRKVIKDRRMFSARGAGIMGFSIFASRMCFALDENMELDLEGIEKFLEENRGKKILLFGFTFILWKHVVKELEKRQIRLSVENGFLIHGGGWKKLASEAVEPEEFRRRVRAVCGVSGISDYYGMAEQTGCIYMECEEGHLHASVYSDILIRDPADHHVCEIGEPGMIEVLSPIPGSYPGNAILTEDMGVLLGEDDCACGRKGKYFKILGRIPRAEVRGCSDTYEG